MSSLLFSSVITDVETVSHPEISGRLTAVSYSSNSASSSSVSSLSSHQTSSLLDLNHQGNIQQEEATQYLDIGGNSCSSNKITFGGADIITPQGDTSILHTGSNVQHQLISGLRISDNMNVEAHAAATTMMQSTRNSSDPTHYIVPSTAIKIEPDASGMALNFSHDLSHQIGGHQPRTLADLGQNSSTTADMKSHQQGSFELDPSCLVPPGTVGMSMWKGTVGINHFKHPISNETHNFIPPHTDLNSFTGWSHGGSFNHHSSNITNHLLEGQHIISYSSQQRPQLPPDHDLVGYSIKVGHQQSAEQASSFMLNSSTSNPQTSSHDTSSNLHSVTQPHDSIGQLRPPHLDQMQSASYNLSINDNQLYNGTRTDNRSQHLSASKTSLFMNDRLMQMSLGSNNGSHVTFHANEHQGMNIQPTTSHHAAAVSLATSSSGSSKSSASFKCNDCNVVFPLKTAYQSHLKHHAHGKGELLPITQYHQSIFFPFINRL